MIVNMFLRKAKVLIALEIEKNQIHKFLNSLKLNHPNKSIILSVVYYTF